MINTNIPYYIYGGVKFYQRKEIKDILAYLRIISHFDDELSILRIINVPQRNIGEITIDKIKQYAYEKHIKFIETFCKQSKGLNGGQPLELQLFQKAKIQLLFGCINLLI